MSVPYQCLCNLALCEPFCCIVVGVFVIGSGDTGVLFEHRESEFGDHANLTDIMNAVHQGKPST